MGSLYCFPLDPLRSLEGSLSITPHSPSVWPLNTTVGVNKTLRYCRPITWLWRTSAVTVRPKNESIYQQVYYWPSVFQWRKLVKCSVFFFGGGGGGFLALSYINKPDSNCRDINTIPDSSNSELKTLWISMTTVPLLSFIFLPMWAVMFTKLPSIL